MIQSSGSKSGDRGDLAVVFQQIEFLAESMAEVKGLVRSLDERLRSHELEEAGSNALGWNRLDAAHRRIDNLKTGGARLSERLDAIESKMPLIDDILAIRTRLIVWIFISGFFGTSVAGLILALLFNYLFKEF